MPYRHKLGGRRLVGAVLVVAVALAMPPAFAAQEIERLIERSDDLQHEQKATEELLDDLEVKLGAERAELGALTESLHRAEAELAAIEQQLEMAEEELATAERRHERARERHEDAIDEVEATEEELAERTEILGTQASAAHRYGGATKYMKIIDAALSESSASDAAIALRQLEHVVDWEADNVQRLADLHDDLLLAEAKAKRAREDRKEEREAKERVHAHVAELHDEQQAAFEEAEARRAEQRELVEAIEGDREQAEIMLTTLHRDLDAVRSEVQEAARAHQAAGGGIICPAPTGSFINDWGFPRSGGREHRGNDIFAAHGDPIFAVDDGTVRSVNRVDRWRSGSESALGGRTVSINTGSNTHWYYAHLDEVDERIERGARVEAGQQIGTIGNTGNARHTPPHLHLGYYPGGRVENPYPLIASACR